MNTTWRRAGATFGRICGAGIMVAFVQASAWGAGPATRSQPQSQPESRPQSRPQTQAQPERVQTPVGTAWRVDLGEQEKGKPWGQSRSPDGKRVFTVRLIAPDGNSALVQEKALQDAIVPLPQADTVLVAEADKPYIQHPFAGTKEELDLAGPFWAMPSPSAAGPHVVLQSVKDLGGGR